MASNSDVDITPGAGAQIATQQISGKEYQVIITSDQSGNLDPVQVVSGSVTANAGSGNFSSKPYVPAAADIVSGSATVTNSVTETTVVTIPAGRTWHGTVHLSVYFTGTASATVKFAHVRTLGTGVSPSAGTILHRVNMGSNNGSSDTSGPFYVSAPVGNAVTITVTNGAATTQVCTASANGVLL